MVGIVCAGPGRYGGLFVKRIILTSLGIMSKDDRVNHESPAVWHGGFRGERAWAEFPYFLLEHEFPEIPELIPAAGKLFSPDRRNNPRESEEGGS